MGSEQSKVDPKSKYCLLTQLLNRAAGRNEAEQEDDR